MASVATLTRWVPPLAIVLSLLGGCHDGQWGRKELPPEPPPPPRSAAINSAVAEGTIGAATLFADVEPMALRGFGLVVGLDGTGSSDCPTVIRDYLIDFMTKQVGPRGGDQESRKSPGELIDSRDTAVVQVFGFVPGGARSGTHFDLYVQVVPSTATRSLEGGLLLPTQLRRFDQAAGGQGLVQGQVLAEAGGPVFVDPFAITPGDTSTPADPRNAYVLGGGRCVGSRPARLMLAQANYRLAKEIERRINERFGQRPPIAQAISRGYLTLETPPQYGHDLLHFQELVGYIYIDNQPDYRERKRRELAQLAEAGTEAYEPIARAWEGFGRSVLPDLRPFYGAPNPQLRYYAARTGTRLGDVLAASALADVAATPNHPQRLEAVRELGDSDLPEPALRLSQLLSDPDVNVRIAAYEGLLKHKHPVIDSRPLRSLLDRTQINCALDTVACDGPPLIYVRRTRLPRIAVFGRHVPLSAPVFYSAPDESVTIVSGESADDIRIYAKYRGHLSEEIHIPPEVTDLVAALAEYPEHDRTEQLRGLGLPYSQVVRVLRTLSEQGVIPAQLVAEPIGMPKIPEAQELPERPEADESRTSSPPPDELNDGPTRPDTEERQ